MTLDGGSMFNAGTAPYKLRPIAAEIYGTKTREFFLGTLKPGGCVVAVDSVESEWMNTKRLTQSASYTGELSLWTLDEDRSS